MQLAYLNAAAVKLAANGPGLDEQPPPQPAASSEELASTAVSMIARRDHGIVARVAFTSSGGVTCAGIIGGLLWGGDAFCGGGVGTGGAKSATEFVTPACAASVLIVWPHSAVRSFSPNAAGAWRGGFTGWSSGRAGG